jgi:hypothetical protein
MPFIHQEKISSIVIAGAGGFGLEVLDYLEQEIYATNISIAGFIDDNPLSVKSLNIDYSYLGTISDFKPRGTEQIVIVAIGSAKARQLVLHKLWKNSVKTPTYVHSTALVSPTAQLGNAIIICPFSIINRNAIVKDGVVINVHCSVGHGTSIGNYSILSPYVALNGDSSIGNDCFLGTRTTIYPQIKIGDGCIVDSHTGVRNHAEDRYMISSRGVYQCNKIR